MRCYPAPAHPSFTCHPFLAACSSCEMRFGVPPPPLEQDKLYNQPCFTTQVGLQCFAGRCYATWGGSAAAAAGAGQAHHPVKPG